MGCVMVCGHAMTLTVAPVYAEALPQAGPVVRLPGQIRKTTASVFPSPWSRVLP